MRRRLVPVALIWACLAGSSCGTSPSAATSFNWSVDSRSYQAVQLGLTFANDSQNTFSGFTCNMGQSITISTPSDSIKFHTGTYSSPGSTTASDAFEVVVNEGLADTNGALPSWAASAGTLSISAVDSSHIAGTFDVTLVPNANSNETGTAHGTGTFDVGPFSGPLGIICEGAAVRR